MPKAYKVMPMIAENIGGNTLYGTTLQDFAGTQQQAPELREGYAIPFGEIRNALNTMPYASHHRVIFGMLALTGCRIEEINLMRRKDLIGNRFTWATAKNQGSPRTVTLPSYYIIELEAYWVKNNMGYGRMFAITVYTYKRMFDRDYRARIGGDWGKMVMYPVQRTVYDTNGVPQKVIVWKQGYKYQMKGLRKTYVTLLFAKNLKKYNGNATAAIEFTSSEMKHSSKEITCRHYMENFERLKIEKVVDLSVSELLNLDIQLPLDSF